MSMRVQDVMTKPVHTVSAESPADGAWELTRLKDIHHLVVMSDSCVVGLLSDRDMGGRHGSAVRAGHTVGELMTKRVVTVDPAAPLRKAANLMRGRSIGCLVVTEKGRVVGIRHRSRPARSPGTWQ
jgi:CBS domain-containing protein